MSAVKEAPARPAAADPALAAWRAVLVHVEPGKADVPRIEAAAALARRCDALLIGLGAELVEPVAFADPYGGWDGQVLTALRAQTQENLAHAEASFRRHAGEARCEWRTVEDRPASALSRLARAAEVIVAGGSTVRPTDPYRSADPAELALVSGRPVLVVPPKAAPLQAKSVVVAWKDAREARRALADALPLLAGAQQVLVVEVCTAETRGDGELHVAEVVEGLKRHGIEARGKVVLGEDGEVSRLVDKEADALGADLIVAGCYGHARFNEWLFGGATRGLLHAPDRYLLISH